MMCNREAAIRRYGLDALRGVGAAMVLLLHVNGANAEIPLIKRGYLAVDLFFILSGFVIGQAYDRDLARRTILVRTYLRRRLVRLYPIIFVALLLGTAVAATGDRAPASLPRMFWLQAVLLPVFLANQSAFPLNSPQWSLFFELAANLFHAVVAPIRNAVLVALVVFAAVAYAWSILDQGSADLGPEAINIALGIPRATFGFFAGLLLYRYSGWRPPTAPASVAVLAMMLTLCAVVLPQWWNVPRVIADLLVVMVVFPAVIWLAASAHLPRRAAAAAALAGDISYPLYAIHLPILTFTASVCRWQDLHGSERRWAWVIAVVVAVTAAWGLGHADRAARRWLQARAIRQAPRLAFSPN